MEQNGLSNFGRRSPNLFTGLEGAVVLSFFPFIALAASDSTKLNDLSNFGRGSPKVHSCIIISKSIHWFRRSHLKGFLILALVAILFNRVERFERFWKRVTQGTFH